MDKLKALSRKISLLGGISALLGWDQETYMPNGAAEIRAEQDELLAGIIHNLHTSEEFKKELGRLIDLKTGKIKYAKATQDEKAALKEWRRGFIKSTALPTSFVEAFSKLTSTALEAWKEARAQSNFSLFAPYLEKIVAMSQEKAELLGYEESPYDALLDIYEPDLKAKEVSKIFFSTEKPLRELIGSIKNPKSTFKKSMEANDQVQISQELLHQIGYDFHYGRLDLSVHPFSTAPHPTDSRITSRILVEDPLSNILSVLHEAGHAFYEMGLPQEHWGTPLGESRSLGIHESQSRFWETRIGLSLPFWKWMAPKLGGTPKALYAAANRVEPSFIRVEADEVTYPMHIMLRFNLEKDLIEGKLKVKEIPEAWRAGMKKLLGITPPDDRLGSLQDVHWSMGSFGYFPTYYLGTLWASHLFEGFEIDHPDWEARVEKGDFKFIRDWLKEKVHRHGKRYSSQELLKRATGKPFSPDSFIRYLRKKYGQS